MPMPDIWGKEYQNFLTNLKMARKSAKMTQQEVAKALGKHQSFIAKCENGERRVDIVELSKFAAIYGKTLSYFLKERP